jgi:hypothetical protein
MFRKHLWWFTHIRRVINRFVRIGSVNIGELTGKSSVSEGVVENLFI